MASRSPPSYLLFDVLCFRPRSFVFMQHPLQEIALYLPFLMHSKMLGQNAAKFDPLEVSFIDSLLGINDKDFANACIAARQADEFDESLPETSAAMFENEDKIRMKVQICLQVVFHSAGPKCELLENPYFQTEVGLILSVALLRLNRDLLSMERVVYVLSKARNCADIIVTVARNNPDNFDLVVRNVLSNGPLLNRLAEMSPWCALRVRDSLTEAQALPDLALHLTQHMVRDILSYCSSVLRAECSWIRLYFQQMQEKENTPAARIRGFLLHAFEEPDVQNNAGRFAQVLHLYSGLCGMWGLRLSPGSSQRIFSAVMANARHSSAVAEQGLCLLLVCEGLCKLLPSPFLGELISMFAQSPVSPTVCLLAVRFAAKHGLAQNAAWAKTVARLPVSIHGESLQQMGLVWRESFPDQQLAALGSSLKPIQGLCASMNIMEDAGVWAVKELLSSQCFLRSRIDLPGWMGKQVEMLNLPIHPCIPELVEEFVAASCPTGSAFGLSPVPVTQLVNFQQSGSLSVRLVGAVLALSHNALVRQLDFKTSVQAYPREVVEGFNLKRLLLETKGASARMLDVLPGKLISLCLSEHPEILMEPMWFVARDEPLVASFLSKEKFSALRARLVELTRLNDQVLCEQDCFKEIFGTILPNFLSHGPETLEEQTVFCGIWRRMYRCAPVAVSLATMQVLGTFPSDELSSAFFTSDPVSVLRLKGVVYEVCYPLFGLVLEILSGYCTTSRKRLLSAIVALPEGSPEREGVARLSLVQDCAIAHLVIEICASGGSEIRLLCCAFLHQLFIQHPQILGMLHHQGYPALAVPVLVEHVPSMHVVIEEIPMLFASNEHSKRAWALLVASHLFEKYPTPRAYEIAKIVMSGLLDSARKAPNQTYVSLLSCLPSFKRVMQAFPVLLDEFVELCDAVRHVGNELWTETSSVFAI